MEYCQSCGSRLTETKIKRSSDNADYCTYCYSGIGFTGPQNISLAEMQKKVEARLKVMFIPHFIGKLVSRKLKHLKRWK